MRTSVVFAIALAAFACKKSGDGSTSAKAPPAPPLRVETTSAAQAEAPDVLVLTGTIVANQRAEVTADTQGKVVNVFVERGDTVKLGQSMIQLDMRTAALSAREASANLAAARAQKELADEECKRTKMLFEKGAITASEYDRQMTQCRAALEQVAATQARTEMMMKSVSDGVVRAPFPGVVDMKNVAPGEWVMPGKPLFTLVDKSVLKVELSVPEIAFTMIKKDAKVKVSAVAHPGAKYDATITRLGAEIGRTRSLIVEATLEKSDLVPGMFVEAHVILKTEPRPVVPVAAIVHRGRQDHVFVVKNGEVEDRIVHLGYPPDDEHATVLGGIAAGDSVVVAVIEEPRAAGSAGSAGSGVQEVHGMALLGDGTKVIDAKAAAAAAPAKAKG